MAERNAKIGLQITASGNAPEVLKSVRDYLKSVTAEADRATAAIEKQEAAWQKYDRTYHKSGRPTVQAATGPGTQTPVPTGSSVTSGLESAVSRLSSTLASFQNFASVLGTVVTNLSRMQSAPVVVSSPNITVRAPEAQKSAYAVSSGDPLGPWSPRSRAPRGGAYVEGFGEIQGGRFLPKYERGGYVQHTGPAIVHRGEYVVPAHQVSYHSHGSVPGAGYTPPGASGWRPGMPHTGPTWGGMPWPHAQYTDPLTFEQIGHYESWRRQHSRSRGMPPVGDSSYSYAYLLAEQRRLGTFVDPLAGLSESDIISRYGSTRPTAVPPIHGPYGVAPQLHRRLASRFEALSVLMPEAAAALQEIVVDPGIGISGGMMHRGKYFPDKHRITLAGLGIMGQNTLAHEMIHAEQHAARRFFPFASARGRSHEQVYGHREGLLHEIEAMTRQGGLTRAAGFLEKHFAGIRANDQFLANLSNPSALTSAHWPQIGMGRLESLGNRLGAGIGDNWGWLAGGLLGAGLGSAAAPLLGGLPVLGLGQVGAKLGSRFQSGIAGMLGVSGWTTGQYLSRSWGALKSEAMHFAGGGSPSFFSRLMGRFSRSTFDKDVIDPSQEHLRAYHHHIGRARAVLEGAGVANIFDTDLHQSAHLRNLAVNDLPRLQSTLQDLQHAGHYASQWGNQTTTSAVLRKVSEVSRLVSDAEAFHQARTPTQADEDIPFGQRLPYHYGKRGARAKNISMAQDILRRGGDKDEAIITLVMEGLAESTARRYVREAQRGLGPDDIEHHALGGKVSDELYPKYVSLIKEAYRGILGEQPSTFHGRRTSPYKLMMAKRLLQSDEILKNLPEDSSYLGSGVSALAMKARGFAYRLQPLAAQSMAESYFGKPFEDSMFSTERPNIPTMLQALSRHTMGTTVFERLPLASPYTPEKERGSYYEHMNKVLTTLQLKTRLSGYNFFDRHPGNIGRVGSEYLIIDPGAVHPLGSVVGGSSSPTIPVRRATGGVIYAAHGGLTDPAASGINWQARGTDNVPAMLTREEHVTAVDSARINRDILHWMDQHPGARLPGFAAGGGVEYHAGGQPVRIQHLRRLQQQQFLQEIMDAGGAAEYLQQQSHPSFGSRFHRFLPGAIRFSGAAGIGHAALAAAPPLVQVLASLHSMIPPITAAVTTLGDATKPVSAGMKSVSDQLPIWGGLTTAAGALQSALQGVDSAMKVATQDMQRDQARFGAQGQFQAQMFGPETAARTSRFRAEALTGFAGSPLDLPPTARTSATERLVYQEQRQLHPIRETMARLGAEIQADLKSVSAANALRDTTGATLRGSQGRYEGAAQRLHGVQYAAQNQTFTDRYGILGLGGLTGQGYDPRGQLMEAQADKERALGEATRDRAEHQRAVTDAMQRQEQLAQRQNQLAQTAVQLANEQYNIAQNRVNIREGAALQIGGMDQVQAQVAVRSLRRVRAAGRRGELDNLSPVEIQEAMSVDRRGVESLLIQRGERRLQQYRLTRGPEAVGSFGGTGSLEEMRRSAEQAYAEVQQATRENAASLARNMASITTDFANRLKEVLQDAMLQAVNKVITDLKTMNSMGGGG